MDFAVNPFVKEIFAYLLGGIDPETTGRLAADHLASDPSVIRVMLALVTSKPLTSADARVAVDLSLGIDVRTGQPLPDNHLFRHEDVRDAILKALLAQRTAQAATLPPVAPVAPAAPAAPVQAAPSPVQAPSPAPAAPTPTGRENKPWSDAEDILLMDLYHVQNLDDRTVASRLGRTYKACARRYHVLLDPTQTKVHFPKRGKITRRRASRKAKVTLANTVQASTPLVQQASQTVTPSAPAQTKPLNNKAPYEYQDLHALLRMRAAGIDRETQAQVLQRTPNALQFKLSMLGLIRRDDPWPVIPECVFDKMVRGWLALGTSATRRDLQEVTDGVMRAHSANSLYTFA